MTTKEFSTNIPVSSWHDLTSLSDITLLEPSYLPAGSELSRLSFSYFPPAKIPTVHNGIVTAVYKLPDGYIHIIEGWGMGLPTTAPIPEGAPHGETTAGKYHATWIGGTGAGGPPSFAGNRKPDAAYLVLGWFPDPKGASGPGWRIETDSLSLDELVRIAASLRPVN